MKSAMGFVLGIIAAFGLVISAQDEFPDGTAISLLQWHHVAPRYDEWFDGYAREWSEARNVAVSVDRIHFDDLPAAFAAEIEAGEGHTLVELLFPPTALIESLHDLSDVNRQALEMFGERAAICQATSYLPTSDSHYAFTHGYAPGPGNYDIARWTAVGYPEGPKSYADLLAGGRAVFEADGIPVGLGLSPEINSEMAHRGVIWSFGGRIQDENENVVLNSDATVAAVNYLARLQNEAMTDEVFDWTASSNNQALVAGEVSYIQNSISAYRRLQKIDAAAAANIGFTGALEGPSGAFGPAHVWQIYVIPSYIEGDELAAAKRFILDHSANYADAVYHSELYNFPCYPGMVGELEGWLEDDPFGSMPADKLEVLKPGRGWSVYLGYPGVSSPAISQVFAERIISTMSAQVARGEMRAEPLPWRRRLNGLRKFSLNGGRKVWSAAAR